MPEISKMTNYLSALSLERGGSFLDWGMGDDGMFGIDEGETEDGETDDGEGERGGKRFS